MPRRKRRFEEDFDKSQRVRRFSSGDAVTNFRKKTYVNKLADEYVRFLGRATVPWFVTNEVIEMAKEKGFSEVANSKNPWWITGPDEASFALIKPGIKNWKKDPLERGIRILASHTDSPCLIAKQRPLYFDWSPDTKELSPGVMMEFYPYGGLTPHQWTSLHLAIHGTGVKSGRRWERTMDGATIGHSAHLDIRDSKTELGDAIVMERVKAFTGHKSRDELLNFLNFPNEDSFFTSRWYAVPEHQVKRLNGTFWISGYGHDDKSGVYASVKALLEDKYFPQTSVVIGFDFEETGSTGAGSAQSKMLERTIQQIKEVMESKLSMDEIIERSFALSVDADVSSGPQENIISEGIDPRNIPRLGYGVSFYSPTGLDGQNNLSSSFKYHMKQLTEKNQIRAQFVGTGHIADRATGAETVGLHIAKKGIITADCGAPINGSHGTVEQLYAPDLYMTELVCRAFLKNYSMYPEIKKKI